MSRAIPWAAAAALLACLSAVTPADGRQGPGKNRAGEEAAKWVGDAGDQFFLTLSGAAPYALVFTTDKGFDKGDRDLKVFVVTREEAAAVVRVLAECGLWGRPDTLPEIHAGRTLAVGRGYQGLRQGVWLLGAADDDVSSLVVVRHLLRTSEGARLQALKDWLAQGRCG